MPEHIAVGTTALGVIDEFQVPTTDPGPGEVLVQNKCAAFMAVDAYQVDSGFFVGSYPTIFGLGGAGLVVKVGQGVVDLQIGDRVAASTFQSNTTKAAQKFSVIPRHFVAKFPENLSFAEASTIPDNFVTAFWTVFGAPNLNLPIPASFPAPSPPADAEVPILVYGAGSTSGQYTVQSLHLAGYSNIITTSSSKHHAYLKSIGANHTFDYASPTLVKDILGVTGGKPVKYAVDPIASKPTLSTIAKVSGAGTKVAVLFPIKETEGVMAHASKMTLDIPERVKDEFKDAEVVGVKTFLYPQDDFLRENLMPKIVPSLLEANLIKPNRFKLINTGTLKERAVVAIDLLTKDQVSGEKLVVEIPE